MDYSERSEHVEDIEQMNKRYIPNTHIRNTLIPCVTLFTILALLAGLGGAIYLFECGLYKNGIGLLCVTAVITISLTACRTCCRIGVREAQELESSQTVQAQTSMPIDTAVTTADCDPCDPCDPVAVE